MAADWWYAITPSYNLIQALDCRIKIAVLRTACNFTPPPLWIFSNGGGESLGHEKYWSRHCVVSTQRMSVTVQINQYLLMNGTLGSTLEICHNFDFVSFYLFH